MAHQTDAGAAEPRRPPQEPAREGGERRKGRRQAPASLKITASQQRKLFALFKAKGITEEEQLPGIVHVIGRPIESCTAMTPDEFEAVVKRSKPVTTRCSRTREAGDRDGDPTPIKALDWHGFLRILAALPIETVERQHHPRRRLRGCRSTPSDSAHCSKSRRRRRIHPPRRGRERAREESKGHLIRTWKRTSTAIPAHVCEVSAA